MKQFRMHVSSAQLLGFYLEFFGQFFVCGKPGGSSEVLKKKTTKRPASTGIFFAQLQYFDQLLQTVKNKTTALKLIFRGFRQTSFPPLIFILYAKEWVSRLSVKIFLSHSAEEICNETFRCFRKFLVSKNFLGFRGGGETTIIRRVGKPFCV